MSVRRAAFFVALGIIMLIPRSGTGSVQAPKTCRSHLATIIGTAGDDVLLGTDQRDVVAARQGDDSVFSLSGNDLMCGGRGDDVLHGGTGRDRGIGGRGTDVCDTENRVGCE